MEIRLLKEEYLKSENLYKDFLDDAINSNPDNFTEIFVHISSHEDFPVYLNETSDVKREKLYLKGFKIVSKIINELTRDIYFESDFWYSYLLTKKREFILDTYPKVKENEKEFFNIVLKKFDWENYIYKLILGAQYITDNIENESEQEHYFKLISNNLDIYNYIIKYEIFRNDNFLLNVLKIIEKNDLSEICKKRLPLSEGLGNDERCGRRVIFELNKSYPMILSPMMTVDELEPIFLENLKKYQDLIK